MQKPTKRKNNFASNLGNAGFGGHLLLRKRTFHDCERRRPVLGAVECLFWVKSGSRETVRLCPLQPHRRTYWCWYFCWYLKVSE
jgi:hypothetical protein